MKGWTQFPRGMLVDLGEMHPWFIPIVYDEAERRRQQQRKSERRIRKARRKAKRCPKCGAKPRGSLIHCRDCLAYAAALMARRRKEGKAR